MRRRSSRLIVPARTPAPCRLGETSLRTADGGRARRLRASLAAATVVAGVVALVAPAAQASSSAPSAPPADPVRPEVPLAADAFVDSVGVVTHFRYQDTAYAQSEELLDAAQELGVRHVRDGFPARDIPELDDVFRQLPEHGLTLNLVVGSAGAEGSLASAADVMAAVDAADIREAVGSIEAPNEWDLKGGDNWRADLQTFQRELYETVRSDAAWDGVPVVGPSVGRKMRVPELAGLGRYMDVTNLHNYAAGDPPETDLNQIERARRIAPGKPLFITETGYHTALEQTDRQKPVSDQAKAEYLVRTLLENFAAGVDRTYLYQLVDERADPERSDQEAHFGLLRSDLSRTPAYDRIRELLTSLSDPDAASGTPQRSGNGFGREETTTDLAPIRLSVSDADPDVQHLVLRKSDGSYYLVLWRRGSLFTDGLPTEVDPTAVTVSFGQRGRSVALVNNGVGELGSARQLQVNLGRSAAVLQLGADAVESSATALTVDVPEPGDTAEATGGMSRTTVVLVVLAVLLLLGAAAVAWTWRRRRAVAGGDGPSGRGGPGGRGGPDGPDGPDGPGGPGHPGGPADLADVPGGKVVRGEVVEGVVVDGRVGPDTPSGAGPTPRR